MKWLLKILTGIQEGAEIDLLPNEEYILGSSDQCDIVLLDSMLPDKALKIAVYEAGVKIIPQDGSVWLGERQLEAGTVENLPAYTVLTIGSLRICVGEDGQPWPELTWPSLEELKKKQLEDQLEAEQHMKESRQAEEVPTMPESGEPGAEAPAEETPAGEPASEKEQASAGETAEPEPPPVRRPNFTIKLLHLFCSKKFQRVSLCILIVLLFILTGLWIWQASAPGPDFTARIQKARIEEFNRVVQRYSLTIVRENDRKILRGNLSDSAERRNVEYLSRLYYPDLELDLSDDETLAIAITESLRGLTNNWVKLISLKDRNAKVSGVLATEPDGKLYMKQIKEDIPKLNRLDYELIYADEMIIKIKKVLALNPDFSKVKPVFTDGQFFLEGQIQEEARPEFQGFLREMQKYFPSTVPLVNTVKWFELQRIKKKGQINRGPTFANLIRGIIITPFPCILLFDGSKCSEGGFLGDYIVESIHADEVILKKGAQRITWRP